MRDRTVQTVLVALVAVVALAVSGCTWGMRSKDQVTIHELAYRPVEGAEPVQAADLEAIDTDLPRALRGEPGGAKE
jgi:hypothetical protein